MRFHGHETFPVREGWLHKGLKLLIEEPQKLVDEYAADWLGVGSNMAKSIRHWLVVTGLSEHFPRKKRRDDARMEKTEFGELIYRQDPYFNELGTWWALHVNLANNLKQATTWFWFFNHFNLNRFERSVCIESLRRYLQVSRPKLPSIKTLQRDVGCLLNTYAKKIPPEDSDPEEAKECPFAELGLLNHFRVSGFYQMDKGAKDIHPCLFGYALSKSFGEDQEAKDKAVDITIREAARKIGGPGRVFSLSSESLFETVLKIESESPSGDIHIAGLAGERIIRVKKKDPLDWLEEYYFQIEQGERDAA